MTLVHEILPFFQIAVSALLVAAILLQQTGAALGGAFGGDNFTASYHTRRGSERFFFIASVILGTLLALSALVALL